ncbi:hypothetical protein [Acidihalobacter prosperus]
MNTQGCRDCGSGYNTLASILGTALYRSMNNAEGFERARMPAKKRAKNRLGLKLGFRIR